MPTPHDHPGLTQAIISPTFMELVGAHWKRGRFVCVGLDPVFERLPVSIRQGRSVSEAFLAFNQVIIDATAEWVCAYKPNAAFYEGEGVEGAIALSQTMTYLKERYPSPSR